MTKTDEIKKGIDELKIRLLEKEPAHFSKKDLADSFFGALILGLTFALKGLVLEVSKALSKNQIYLIILSTLIIITAEIYLIGYSRVVKKSERKFGQFWIKRVVAFYGISLIVSVFLVYIFGLNNLIGAAGHNWEVQKLIFVISMPAAIGAAIGDLLKKY